MSWLKGVKFVCGVINCSLIICERIAGAEEESDKLNVLLKSLSEFACDVEGGWDWRRSIALPRRLINFLSANVIKYFEQLANPPCSHISQYCYGDEDWNQFFRKWIVIDCNLLRINSKTLSMPGVLLIALSRREWKQFSRTTALTIEVNRHQTPHTSWSVTWSHQQHSRTRWKRNRSQRDWCKIDGNEKWVIRSSSRRNEKYFMNFFLLEEKWFFREQSFKFSFISSHSSDNRRRRRVENSFERSRDDASTPYVVGGALKPSRQQARATEFLLFMRNDKENLSRASFPARQWKWK